MDYHGLRDQLHRRFEGLRAIRNNWDGQYRDLENYIMPGNARFTLQERKGKNKQNYIADPTAIYALRVLRSGMMSGMTSPARPWFRLTTIDPDLAEFGPVKDYLSVVQVLMRERFAASNIYNMLHAMYGDLGQFGTACGIVNEDADSTISGVRLVTGQFWIGQNHNGIVDTLFREIMMTVEQVVGRFVYKGERFGEPDWSVVSPSVKNLWDNGNLDQWVEICHGIYPRTERDVTRKDARNKPFASCYYEKGNDKNLMLQVSGYDENPILAPRWDVLGDDFYGYSPGMAALPDVKQLQVMVKRKGEAVERMVRPTLQGPTSMRNHAHSLLPGGIVWSDDPTGFRPAYEVRPPVNELRGDIQAVQESIRSAFYADLFMAISQMEGVQPRNQFELAERKDEKLIQLGPVLERLQGADLLQSLIRRTYAIMARRGELPEPPEELDNTEMKVDYISMLAQAQKAVSTGAIERLWSFAGNLAGIKPDILDKLDADQTLDEYGEALGIAPDIILSDDKTQEIRQSRQEAMQQQQQAEQAAQVMPAMRDGAQAAKLLSEADQGGNVSDTLERIGLA